MFGQSGNDIDNVGFLMIDTEEIIPCGTTTYTAEYIDLSICALDSVFLGGAWQNTAGIYSDTLDLLPFVKQIIITTLTVNDVSYSVDVQVACNSFTWIDGITYTESNNVVTHVLTNALNCDSIITLDLTVHRDKSAEIMVTT